MSRKPILQLKGVSACYGDDEYVLRGIDLDLCAGEVAAVVSIDTSGGLTTLLKIAAGLQRPTEGSVEFEGRDVYAMGYREDQRMRARVGVVLEGGALHPNRSIWENVAFPLRYHGERRGDLAATVERLLSDCGFNEDPKSLPWQISARGRKLAGLARALSRDPEVVIVDRFFEGLEMPDWRRLFELVMELNQHSGVSWLLISEVDSAIFQVAERVAVLERGELIGYDHRRRLLEVPKIRAAFEEAAAIPIAPTRRAQPVSGQLVGLDISSAPLGEASSLEMDLTINIDGRLPRDPGAMESDLMVVLEGEPTIDLSPDSLPTPTLAESTEGVGVGRPAEPSLVDPAEAAKKKRKAARRRLAPPSTSLEDSAPAEEEATPAAPLEDPHEVAKKKRKAAKRTVQAPAPVLEDPTEVAKKKRKAAKRTVQAPAPVLEDPTEVAKKKRKAAKRTVQAPAPVLEDPTEVAEKKRKTVKRTIKLPPPVLEDPTEVAKKKRKAAKRTVQAPAPVLEDPTEVAEKKLKTAKRTVKLPPPVLEDPTEVAKKKRKAAKRTVPAPIPTPAAAPDDPAGGSPPPPKSGKRKRDPRPPQDDPADEGV